MCCCGPQMDEHGVFAGNGYWYLASDIGAQKAAELVKLKAVYVEWGIPWEPTQDEIELNQDLYKQIKEQLK